MKKNKSVFGKKSLLALFISLVVFCATLILNKDEKEKEKDALKSVGILWGIFFGLFIIMWLLSSYRITPVFILDGVTDLIANVFNYFIGIIT